MRATGAAAYNNVDEMFPSQARLMNALRSTMALTQTSVEKEKVKKPPNFIRKMSMRRFRERKTSTSQDRLKERRQSSVQSETWIKTIVNPSARIEHVQRQMSVSSEAGDEYFSGKSDSVSSNLNNIKSLEVESDDSSNRRGSKESVFGGVQMQATFEAVKEEAEGEHEQDSQKEEEEKALVEGVDDIKPCSGPSNAKKPISNRNRKISTVTRSH